MLAVRATAQQGGVRIALSTASRHELLTRTHFPRSRVFFSVALVVPADRISAPDPVPRLSPVGRQEFDRAAFRQEQSGGIRQPVVERLRLLWIDVLGQALRTIGTVVRRQPQSPSFASR